MLQQWRTTTYQSFLYPKARQKWRVDLLNEQNWHGTVRTCVRVSAVQHILKGLSVLGGPLTGVPVNIWDHEQGSICSGNSTPDTVIWHGGPTRSWSVMEDSPRRTPTQDPLLGQNQVHSGMKCVPHSPSTNRDLRMKGLMCREGCCPCCRPAENLTGCSCCRVPCRMSSSGLSNNFTPQGANTEDHAQSNCESHHLTACHRSTCSGHTDEHCLFEKYL